MRRQWAHEAVAILQAGGMARIYPTGNSMQGRICAGDCVTLQPCENGDLNIGDVVLARVRGRRYTHLVLHLIVSHEAGKFLIGNNFGRMDGWVDAENIFGKVVSIETQ